MMAALNYSPYLCAGAVVLVANKLSDADRQDGLDALLYSQTVASRKCPDFAEFEPWITASRSAMKTLGGMLLSEPGNSYPAYDQGSFKLGDLAQATLGQLMSVDAERSLKTCLTALSLRPLEDAASALVQASTVQNHKRVLFRFGVISPGVSIVFAALSFEYDDDFEGHVLNHRFRYEKVVGNLSIAGFKALVEPEDYDFSRETIRSLLGASRLEQVIGLT